MAAEQNPFRELVSLWRERIEAAERAREQFSAGAREAMLFYTGSVDEIYRGMGAETYGARFTVTGEGPHTPQPQFKAAVNKVFELKSIVGPYLYHDNPHRTCTVRRGPDLSEAVLPLKGPAFVAAMQAEQAERESAAEIRSTLMQHYLNYTPNELTGYGLKRHARLAIDEALIKGRGCLWTEVISFPGANLRIVGSTFDSVDKLLIDPDAECLDDAGWIARARVWPAWKVEEVFGLKPGSVKGNLSSAVARAQNKSLDSVGPHKNPHREAGKDLVLLHEVFSKVGLGGRLRGSPGETDRQTLREADEVLGDFCYLVLAEGMDYFLNLPPETDVTELSGRLGWPTPFWADGMWPVQCVDFHSIPRSPWPMSSIQPAMAELKAMNWLFSFVVSKIAKISRDFVAVMKGVSEDVIRKLESGEDLTILELDKVHQSINESIQFLQQPRLHPDLWRVLDMVMGLFERRTGLSELLFGEGAMRSAEEAALKGERTQIRITAMATDVENWMTHVSRAEAFAAWYHLEAPDLLPVLGPVHAYLWDEFIRAQPRDVITRELDYRIEAGSVKKPNQERQIANMTQALQNIMPLLVQFAPINPTVVHQINALLTDWAKSMDLDPSRYLMDENLFLSMMQPPTLSAPPGSGGDTSSPPPEPPPEQGPPPDIPPEMLMAALAGGGPA